MTGRFRPEHLELGEVPTADIRINPRSRDDVPKILRGIRSLVSNAGADAHGGFRSEGFWGSAANARVGVSDDADGDQFLTSLGAHALLSEHIFVGGMLQHDRSGTTLDGDLGFGKISGSGWMAGPYFVARDASSSLLFEGRLLYGRSSNDVEATGRRERRDPGTEPSAA